VVAFVLMKAVDAIGLLRVSQEGEALGLDLHEHGISAYPEYVLSATGRPSALVVKASGSGLAPDSVSGMRAVEPAN
jgi:hypothetical protein